MAGQDSKSQQSAFWCCTLPYPCILLQHLLGDTPTFWSKGDTFRGAPGPVPIYGALAVNGVLALGYTLTAI